MLPFESGLFAFRRMPNVELHVFSGVVEMDQITRKHTDLRLVGRTAFGSHYAETLRQWDEAFTTAHERVLALGFDETFLRMWHFYLAYSRAGFASGYLDVQQLTFTRTSVVEPVETERPR